MKIRTARGFGIPLPRGIASKLPAIYAGTTCRFYPLKDFSNSRQEAEELPIGRSPALGKPSQGIAALQDRLGVGQGPGWRLLFDREDVRRPHEREQPATSEQMARIAAPIEPLGTPIAYRGGDERRVEITGVVCDEDVRPLHRHIGAPHGFQAKVQPHQYPVHAIRNPAEDCETPADRRDPVPAGQVRSRRGLSFRHLCQPMDSFHRGRDFAAWLGLVPRQKSTGGKQRLGKVSKMGQRDIRRLLIIGAMAVVSWAARNGASEGSWLARMMARKPRMVVAIALANKMARSVWAMLVKQENYRDPMAAAA